MEVPKHYSILGVPIDNYSKEDILNTIHGYLKEPGLHQIATINPQYILETERNTEFKKLIRSCQLRVADGIGIRLAFWRYGKKLQTRITGVRLMHELLTMANDRSLRVFLAARHDGLSTWEETGEAIKKLYPRVKVSGANVEIHDLDYLVTSECEILFCNFGAPQQEFFIQRQKNAILGVGIGVGGSFDYLTGRVWRAPVFVRRLGLEWFWRLLQLCSFNPRLWRKGRLKKILQSIIVFPLKIIGTNEKSNVQD